MNEPKFTDEDLKWNKERSLLSTDNLRVPPSEMLALIARLEAAEVLAGKADKQLKAADELAKAVRSFWKEDVLNWPDVQRALKVYEKVRND